MPEAGLIAAVCFDQIARQQPGPVGSDAVGDATRVSPLACVSPLASQAVLGVGAALTGSPAEGSNHAGLEDLALAVSTESAHVTVCKALPCHWTFA